MFPKHALFYPVKGIAVYFGWLWRLELCDKTFYNKALKFSEPSILTQHYDHEYQDDDFQYSENHDNYDDYEYQDDDFKYPETHDNYYDYDDPDSKADKNAETINGNSVSF